MMLFLLVKALHIVSMVAWFAGLFYLPRLFAYHAEATSGGEAARMLEVMERRLLRIIMNPAMIATLAFGIWLLVLEPGWLQQGWLHAKLTIVVLLVALHMAMAAWRRALVEGRNRHGARFFRIVNEAPTLALLLIVVLVVVKPF
jgi:putative membrane protein